MITLLLLALLACSPPPPPPKVASPLPEEVVNTITIKVPADCPHLIVDVTSDETTDVTAACFVNNERTYFAHEEAPLFCTADDPSVEEFVKLEYIQDLPYLSSVH